CPNSRPIFVGASFSTNLQTTILLQQSICPSSNAAKKFSQDTCANKDYAAFRRLRRLLLRTRRAQYGAGWVLQILMKTDTRGKWMELRHIVRQEVRLSHSYTPWPLTRASLFRLLKLQTYPST